METILIHRFSGLLSAYGMGLADIRASRVETVDLDLNAAWSTLTASIAGVRMICSQELMDQGVDADDINLAATAHIRYDGTDTALDVAIDVTDAGLGQDQTEALRAAFLRLHETRFGFVDHEKPLVVEALSVEAIGGAAYLNEKTAPEIDGEAPRVSRQTRFFSDGAWRAANVYVRADLMPGHVVGGPVIIIEPNQTIVVEPGWQAKLSGRDHLVLTRTAARPQAHAIGTSADPVMLEIFNNLFMSIAEQMGVTLQNTAYSVNIKERLDFSCAVFDPTGALVANAPHMPVHLGSMDKSVRAIIDGNAGIRPGDVFALNAPYNGGTHLPDITVCSPVFGADGREIIFWVASRGHHADIGGLTPGSMSTKARTIEEEGVYIDNFKLIEAGVFREKELAALLTGATYPVRNIVQNINDLKAQVAANECGATELNKMIRQFGLDVVKAYMGHVQDNADESVRRVLDRLSDGDFTYEMDDGSVVKVRITVDKAKREATVDFTGTSPQRGDNFNAPAPVTRAAVLYVFRVMVDDDIPMNAGCLRPINLIVPEGSILAPLYPAAVVAGNVEVSQAVTNCLFGALGALAAAQGTMNNLTFGNHRYQYYETICSGAPAGPDFDGVAGIHTHMTNSRLTDPEVLETRFPVVLEEFSVRRGSGGKGRHKAGDGTKRTIRFRETMECDLLTGHRRIQPFGLEGGEPGEIGRNQVRRANGGIEELGGCDSAVLQAGEAITIITPTGGGFGPVSSRWKSTA